MTNSFKPIIGVSILALTSAALAGGAQAQTAPVAAEGSADIVVTAQKREQTLIDVPLSITAVTGEALAKRGASTIEDLQYAVPGISITEFSPGQQRVQMRGVSVYSGLPTVGTYLDEIPLNLELNQTGQDVRLLDIARVEVLRGPQGTLYGQGAVGGTIRYITNPVNLAHVEASANGEIAGISGGGTDWKADGMVNVPLVGDRVGLRVAGSYQHFGGWIDNPTIGAKDVNGGHTYALRGKLSAKLTDDLKLVVTAQHQDLKIGAQNLSDANQNVFSPLATPYASRATLANALATYDFGSVTLLSSTSYIKRNDLITTDLTATFAPFIPLLTGAPTVVQSVGATSRTQNKVFVEEARLSSNGGGRFNWTAGGFYRNSRTDGETSSVITPNVLPPALVLYGASGTYPDNSRSWAAFGEGSYRIFDTLTALVGLRYFHDSRAQDTVSTIFAVPASDHGRGSFHAVSPRFNLSWQPNRQLNVYANVGKGFRSGGFNLTSTGGGAAVPPTYSPDSIWTYEVGAKYQSADRKLSLEIAGYRNIWDHVQTTTNIPGLPTNFTTNGGKISGWGADGAINYSPIPALTLSLNGGWNNMAYRTATVEHLAGDRVDYVPRFTGSVSGEYRFDVARMPAYLRIDYQHADRFQVFVRNFQAIPAFSDKQDILNARLGLARGNWSGSIFVRNLLNRDSVLYPAFAALIYPSRLEPRTIGASLGLKY